jgi:hypothetical protein
MVPRCDHAYVGRDHFRYQNISDEPMFSRWQRSARNQLLFYGGTVEQISAIGGKADLDQLLVRLEDNTPSKRSNWSREMGRCCMERQTTLPIFSN